MSNWREIQNIYNKLKLKSKKNLVILQCTSQYPSKLNDVGLNVISEIKKRFKCNSGLSDHSGSVFPGITVISRNEDFLEVHVKLDSKSNFPDKSTSLNMNSLKFLQDYNNAMVALNNKVDKDKIYKKFSKMRKLFGRSLALKKKMIKGQIIKKEDLILKKPGTGLSIKYLSFFIGKKLNKTIVHDELLKKSIFIKKKRKICVVINSRPNYSRIKSFLKAAKENKNIDLDILVGASALLYRFGEVIKIIKKDGFKISQMVHSIVEGKICFYGKIHWAGYNRIINSFSNIKLILF